jgi:hypothetical protein
MKYVIIMLDLVPEFREISRNNATVSEQQEVLTVLRLYA